jgi:hypothetical protein
MSEPPEEGKNGNEPAEHYGPSSWDQIGPKPMAPTNWVLTQERNWHRPAAALAAAGCSISKIARTLDKHRATVSNLFKQDAFWVMVREELQEVRQDVRKLFDNEVARNLAVLAELRDNESTPANARVNAVKELNDRSMGRPVQPIATAQFLEPDVSSDNVVETVARLERETDALYAKRHGLPAAQPQNDDTDDVNDAD